MVLPIAKLSVGEIAEAHNVRPHDIYIRFKKEICSVSFTLYYILRLAYGVVFPSKYDDRVQ
jgi:hypothetical protein